MVVGMCVSYVDFARYAAIVKNLRGVVAADLEESGVEESIKWLASRFRYRDLGVGPMMVERFGSKLQKFLGGKPLRELVYPVPQLLEFVDILVESTGIERMLAEAMTLASTYISPLMIVGNRFLNAVERLGVEIVRTSKEMDVQSWKLHMRIADYTVLDFYEQCIEEALQVIERASTGDAGLVEEVVKSRAERIAKDVSRYWRIRSGEGRTFLVYIDMLKLVKNRVRDLKREHAAALAIVPAIYIPPGMG